MSRISPASRTDTESPVPFLDLAPMNEVVRETVLNGLSRLFETGAFVNGPAVVAFEEAFSEYCGSQICVGLSSGLDAIRIGLLAAGIERGDEVVIPANTFAATFEAVTQAGGVPVVADVRHDDYNLDVEAAASVVTSRTRFLLPVHLYGQLADMRSVADLARRHDLAVIEDAAQAHGAERDGLRAGSSGLAAAFSFYPAKNLGALGDAGALTTDNQELASRARALREHGQLAKYVYSYEGYTARLDTIQAIALAAKLPHLETWNAQRRELAAGYGELLAGVGDLKLPFVVGGSGHVWHLYVVRTADPTALAASLAASGISSGRHYPEPPHLSEAYAYLGYLPGSFPVTERICSEGLSLPLYPGMTEAQLARVCDAVQAYFADG